MGSMDKRTVEHLAKLSRLRFSETELQSFTKQLDEIFEYAKSLQEVNTDHIEPSAHAVPLQNVFKDDEVKNYPNIEKLFENAPEKEENSFKVPRILTS